MPRLGSSRKPIDLTLSDEDEERPLPRLHRLTPEQLAQRQRDERGQLIIDQPTTIAEHQRAYFNSLGREPTQDEINAWMRMVNNEPWYQQEMIRRLVERYGSVAAAQRAFNLDRKETREEEQQRLRMADAQAAEQTRLANNMRVWQRQTGYRRDRDAREEQVTEMEQRERDRRRVEVQNTLTQIDLDDGLVETIMRAYNDDVAGGERYLRPLFFRGTLEQLTRDIRNARSQQERDMAIDEIKTISEGIALKPSTGASGFFNKLSSALSPYVPVVKEIVYSSFGKSAAAGNFDDDLDEDVAPATARYTLDPPTRPATPFLTDAAIRDIRQRLQQLRFDIMIARRDLARPESNHWAREIAPIVQRRLEAMLEEQQALQSRLDGTFSSSASGGYTTLRERKPIPSRSQLKMRKIRNMDEKEPEGPGGDPRIFGFTATGVRAGKEAPVGIVQMSPEEGMRQHLYLMLDSVDPELDYYDFARKWTRDDKALLADIGSYNRQIHRHISRVSDWVDSDGLGGLTGSDDKYTLAEHFRVLNNIIRRHHRMPAFEALTIADLNSARY